MNSENILQAGRVQMAPAYLDTIMRAAARHNLDETTMKAIYGSDRHGYRSAAHVVLGSQADD